MIKAFNIGAILLLIYFYRHIEEYAIQVEEKNSLSRIIVKILQGIPKPQVWLLILIIIIVISLITKSKWKYIGYILSTIIIEISIAIILSELSLESYTSCYVLQIYHPITMDIKLGYLEDEIAYCYSQIIPELSKYSIDQLNEVKSYIEENVNHNYVSRLNAEGLSEYARILVITGLAETNNIKFPITIDGRIITITIIVAIIKLLFNHFDAGIN